MRTITDYHAKDAVRNVKAAIAVARGQKKYNAFLHLTEKRAMERALKVEAGEITGKLAGVPFAVKDNLLAFDGPTTAGSRLLKDFMAPVQAESVERLEAEGAICIGKTNLDAFGHGGSTENSAFGPTLNVADQTRVAGGSSGGSAVAVGLDVVPFALGSDTGGSIRQPASFNGVFGIKPTYGAVSRYGLITMASSTDTVGCFAHTAQDVETVMSIMSGRDDKDMTSLPDFFQPTAVKSLRVGVIKEFMEGDIDSGTRRITENYIARMKEAGHQVQVVEFPLSRQALSMYYIIVAAESNSALARLDGIHFGTRSKADSLEATYTQTRTDGFEEENKRRILLGSYVLSSGQFDEYYVQAAKARTMLIDELNMLLQEVDVLVGPVAPTPAFKIGEKSDDEIEMYRADMLAVPASLAGLPALSAPGGLTESGAPVGVQLIGQKQSDAMLLALAAQMEEK